VTLAARSHFQFSHLTLTQPALPVQIQALPLPSLNHLSAGSAILYHKIFPVIDSRAALSQHIAKSHTPVHAEQACSLRCITVCFGGSDSAAHTLAINVVSDDDDSEAPRTSFVMVRHGSSWPVMVRHCPLSARVVPCCTIPRPRLVVRCGRKATGALYHRHFWILDCY
jgi:hypothetical protein